VVEAHGDPAHVSYFFPLLLLAQIDAFDVELPSDVLMKIDHIHESHLDPCASL
jgi:hypothetical protein